MSPCRPSMGMGQAKSISTYLPGFAVRVQIHEKRLYLLAGEMDTQPSDAQCPCEKEGIFVLLVEFKKRFFGEDGNPTKAPKN